MGGVKQSTGEHMAQGNTHARPCAHTGHD